MVVERVGAVGVLRQRIVHPERGVVGPAAKLDVGVDPPVTPHHLDLAGELFDAHRVAVCPAASECALAARTVVEGPAEQDLRAFGRAVPQVDVLDYPVQVHHVDLIAGHAGTVRALGWGIVFTSRLFATQPSRWTATARSAPHRRQLGEGHPLPLAGAEQQRIAGPGPIEDLPRVASETSVRVVDGHAGRVRSGDHHVMTRLHQADDRQIHPDELVRGNLHALGRHIERTRCVAEGLETHLHVVFVGGERCGKLLLRHRDLALVHDVRQ